MPEPNKRPPEGGRGRGCQTHPSINGSPYPIEPQYVDAGALAELVRWLTHNKRKSPHDGEHGYDAKDSTRWLTLADAVARALEWHGLTGVGLAFAGGITIDGWHLVGLDFDRVDFERWKPPFAGYSEKSPSGKGVHLFGLVPEAVAAAWHNRMGLSYPGCAHLDVFVDAGYLTMPGVTDSSFILDDAPIPILEGDDLTWLGVQLKPKPGSSATPAVPAAEGGSPVDLTPYAKTENQKALLRGESGFDRSPEVHRLLRDALDGGETPANLKATLLQWPPFWEYLLDHRQRDETKAVEFAGVEVEKAYAQSMKGIRAGMLALGQRQESPTEEGQLVCLISARELAQKAGPIDWLIEGYLEANTKLLMYGQSGHCKTVVVHDMAAAIASGEDWHGHPVKQGAVVYVCGEGHNGIARRLMAACQQYGRELEDLPIYTSRTQLNLTAKENAENLKRDLAVLAARGETVVLLIIDTLAKNMGDADENSTRDMNAYLNEVDMLRGEASVIPVHHTGHSNQDRARGASSLQNGVDARTLVEREGDLVIITPQHMKDAETPPAVCLTIVKADLFEENGKNVQGIALTDDPKQHAILVQKFYENHPNLAGKGRSHLKINLPKVLEAAYANVGASKKKLANITGISDSTVADIFDRLREYGMAEKGLFTLTEKGREAARILVKNLWFFGGEKRSD